VDAPGAAARRPFDFHQHSIFARFAQERLPDGKTGGKNGGGLFLGIGP
jgi:hypothetical protein